MTAMNILITSAGRRTYLVKYFKKELSSLGKVHVANSTDTSPAFQFADKYVVTPLIYDKDYIPFLLNYCRNNKIKAVISLFDIDLPVLAKNKEKFDEIGVKLIVSDKEVIDICNDKWKTYNYLSENGFNTPKTYLSLKNAQKALSENKVTYPLIVKPRWGMGSIGVFEANNGKELEILYNKVLETIRSSYIKYESDVDITNSVIIQEKIDGQEYGLDIINNLNGEYINTVVKQKYAMRSGETDCAITVDAPQIKEVGKKLSEKLRHIANLDVDVFVKNDKVYILEMNARFGGGYPFSHMAGVNLPKAIVGWLSGKKVDSSLFVEETNVLSHKIISLAHIYKNLKVGKEQLNLQILKDYLQKVDNSYNPPLSSRTDLTMFAEKLVKYADFVVAKIDDKIAGLMAYYANDTESKQAYITSVSVLEAYRGNGLASKMLDAVIDDIASKSFKKVCVRTEVYNHSAINLYNKHGFVIEQKENSKLLFGQDL